jgi:heme-degrading monooxygenase HmoA
MFVALSKFEVKTDAMAAQVKQAFLDRPHLVEAAPGFVRLDVISPCENEKEIWLITYWAERADYTVWHKSHSYHDSHAGIPAGLKLNAGITSVTFFEYIAS